MKRIGERLQAETQRLIGDHAPGVQAGQHPFLAALDRHGALTVGELAGALGITQPGVTRTVARLAALGLVEASPARGDQRQKVVTLTREGRRLVAIAKAEVWPRIERAVADLCRDLDGPLLDQLGAIEDRLAAEPLAARAARPQRRRAR
jgi:DNA-binding MarR family transcriptional regulator